MLALGATSFLTDVASEMVASILPLYLTLGLGLPVGAVGVVDGLGQATTMAVRPLGGLAADRTRRPKRVATGGYALSAAARTGLAAAAVTGMVGWWTIVTALVTDRVGKGVRTAPRDALISLSAAPARLATAFGLHRALDTAGALAGPLLAIVLLGPDGRAFDAVLVTSALVGIGGVAVISLVVRDRGGLPAPTAATGTGATGTTAGATTAEATTTAATTTGPGTAPATIRRRLREPGVRRLLGAAAVLGLTAIPDSLLFLAVVTTTDLPLRWFPLLPVASAATFVVLAVPLGRLADRLGRRTTLLGGHAALAVVTAAVALAATDGAPTVALIAVALAVHGAHYAATDGVLAALASVTSPPQARSTVLSLTSTASVGGRLTGAAVVGLLWHAVGLGTALWLASGSSLVAVVIAARLLGLGR
ncbi:MAG: MFS transporter [Actinomycetota bacterium]|nr:MFS transporter [Actinomycetota bacterium]